MSKLHSLTESRWLRFRAFLRGLLFYNTVYWRRASDAVNRRASRVSRDERERARPQVDPEMLRPRAKPRVHGAAAQGIVPPPPTALDPEMSRASPPAGDEALTESEAEAEAAALPPPPSARPEPDGGSVETPERRRRRVYRRKQKAGGGVDPLRGLARGNAERPGWWRRLLGRD